MGKRIILDCDPGHDDAMAILLAYGCPDIDLVAITTVAGNQTLDKTTLNARRVCTVAGIHDVPVYAGRWRPLRRAQVTAADIHGASGLDGPEFGEPTVPVQPEPAVDFLVRTLMAEGEGITLVPTGPLTNVAAALQREPRIAGRLREVVLMGGAYTRGNRHPAAEFNMLADPEAASLVFAAGWPLTMISLDLTRQAVATAEVLARIRAMGTAVSQMVTDMMEFYAASYRRSGQDGAGEHGAGEHGAGPPVHDPCAVARVARPDLMTVADAFVAVETRGEWTSGMTVTDFRGILGHPPNTKVATTLDAGGFWELMLNALEAIGGRTPDGAERAGEKADETKAGEKDKTAKGQAAKDQARKTGKGQAAKGQAGKTGKDKAGRDKAAKDEADKAGKGAGKGKAGKG